MQDTKIDVSHIKFSSAVFPTDEDMELWYSLSSEEQHAVLRRELDEGEASGIAAPETMGELMQRVRAETAHDL
ncbi:MAG: hypothetical protein GY792_14735 [Gammaproteobacteria bacterium]|nr:hypothetical protein [Gammaproteobacteria bacterium]